MQLGPDSARYILAGQGERVARPVRLLHTAAGPPVALAAAQVIPPHWLLLACVVHVVWSRKPELI